MTVSWLLVLSLGVAVLVGSIVQGSVGFGVAVVVAPLAVMLAPSLMPGSVLIAGFGLALIQFLSGRAQVDWRAFGWSMVGRLVLIPVGVLLVARWSTTAIAVTVGVLLLVTVALALRTVALRNTPLNALLAGAVGGVSGTAASIGGPFIALVLRHEPPERARGTLGATFLLGSVSSLVGLWLGGQMSREQLCAGLVWLPFVAVGYAVAAPLRRRLDPDAFRRWVLVFCVVAGVAVLVRAAAG